MDVTVYISNRPNEDYFLAFDDEPEMNLQQVQFCSHDEQPCVYSMTSNNHVLLILEIFGFVAIQTNKLFN